MISERKQRLKYVIGDYVTSSVAWLTFNCIRFYMTHVGYTTLAAFLTSSQVLLGQVVFPLLMMGVYWLSGYYNEVFRKSRLQELFTTFSCATVNMLLIFFIALINDVNVVRQRSIDYEVILVLWALLFGVVYAWRYYVTSDTSARIKSRRWSFATLIVGRGAAAVAYVNRLNAMPQSLGYRVVAYVSIPGENDVKDVGDVPCYSINEVQRACREHAVKEIIVVPTRHSDATLMNTVNGLFELGLPIKVRLDDSTMAMTRMRIDNMVGEPLVDVSSPTMGDGAVNVKRTFDVVVSILVLVLLSPLLAVVALLIKRDSPGPVFYRQQRVGLRNKLFNIIKFRSMVADAEATAGPQLAMEDDPRVTHLGRWLRKYRIDELPQFWNVLVGDMSIVGPRPERPFYVEQILRRAPSYALLHQLRPGITSMGMVKYGYATSVDEMVERLRYDLIYLENMSLLNDVKIMVYTVRTVLTGQGM